MLDSILFCLCQDLIKITDAFKFSPLIIVFFLFISPYLHEKPVIKPLEHTFLLRIGIRHLCDNRIRVGCGASHALSC